MSVSVRASQIATVLAEGYTYMTLIACEIVQKEGFSRLIGFLELISDVGRQSRHLRTSGGDQALSRMGYVSRVGDTSGLMCRLQTRRFDVS
jgi:hypothetical protein